MILALNLVPLIGLRHSLQAAECVTLERRVSRSYVEAVSK